MHTGEDAGWCLFQAGKLDMQKKNMVSYGHMAIQKHPKARICSHDWLVWLFCQTPKTSFMPHLRPPIRLKNPFYELDMPLSCNDGHCCCGDTKHRRWSWVENGGLSHFSLMISTILLVMQDFATIHSMLMMFFFSLTTCRFLQRVLRILFSVFFFLRGGRLSRYWSQLGENMWRCCRVYR